VTSNQKLFGLLLGVIAAFLITSQLVLGELLKSGESGLRNVHAMTGRITAIVVVVYLGLSIWHIITSPTKPKTTSP
jgi:hypothetical protein